MVARTAGELRKLLEGIPDDTKILVPGCDHSYRPGTIVFGEAVYSDKYNHWSESYKSVPLQRGEKRINVLIVERRELMF